jgi:hypothetical protein
LPAGTIPLSGVVILGMHRSGTSLITRLVSLLGLAVCRDDDLLVGRKGNPRGHWESMSLLAFNSRLLDELGGTWFCPPLLGSKELSRMLDRHATNALARFQDAHPERPWVWKDPRTPVLLPFWSAVLGQRAAYVLVVRHPFEVSDSLARRNGCTPLLSLALWERYTRQAMLGAAGRPMMVCTYDGVLADPVGWCERLVAFLDELGAPACAVDRAVAGAFAMDGLRHSYQSWTELRSGPLISAEQVALAKAARVPTAQRSYVPPPLPPETPETESIFREIRQHVAKRSSGRRHLVGLPPHLVSAPAPRRNAGQASRPPVSVVLARSGAAIEASIPTLGATLPAGSEILLAGEEHALTGDWSRRHEVSLRQIDCDQPPGEAEALALGVQAARGRIVLLTTASLLRYDPWYAPLKQALAPLQVAGVGPMMRFESCPDRRYLGRAFTDEDLASHLVAGDGAQAAPVPAALLFDAHSAYDRRVLTAAGGVDEGFSSACSAVAELSLRLWRMGFRCRTVPQVEVWSEDAHEDDVEDDAARLHDRLRIATLHFDAPRLQAFTERASRSPWYDSAAARLMASDVERRRAAIAAVCAFPIDRYFDSFPLVLQTRS